MKRYQKNIEKVSIDGINNNVYSKKNIKITKFSSISSGIWNEKFLIFATIFCANREK